MVVIALGYRGTWAQGYRVLLDTEAAVMAFPHRISFIVSFLFC